MKATVKENLIAARALIDTPEKWIKGEFGDMVSGCYCSIGAVAAVLGISGEETELNSKEAGALARAMPGGWGEDGICVPDFNDADATTHADIMALFDRAIAAQDGAS